MFCFLDKLLTVAPCEASNGIILLVLILPARPPRSPPLTKSGKWMSHRSTVGLSILPVWSLSPSSCLTCRNQKLVITYFDSKQCGALLPWTYTWCSCGDSWLCKRALRRHSSAESHIPGTQIWQMEGETTRWAKTYRATIVVQKKVICKRKTNTGDRGTILRFLWQALCLEVNALRASAGSYDRLKCTTGQKCTKWKKCKKGL